MKKNTFSVIGMHCSSCELLIENKLLKFPGIEKVEASSIKEQVCVYYKENAPSLQKINEILKDDGYCLCEECGIPEKKENTSNSDQLIKSILIALAVFLGFIGLNRLGFSSLVNVSKSSSLPTFILFGLLAGVSTCAALTGGIVLSLSNQWGKNKMTPHFLFNLGRLISFAIFGFVLGMLGNKLQLSLTFNAFLVLAVSLLMIASGLKMLGVKAFQNFQIALPKSFTRKISNQNNFQGQMVPAIMGALTVFLPCGFTITTESLALLSGNPTQGALIMAAFALGTAPGLLAIGFSAVKMSSSNKSAIFTKAAGALVLMFAIFNINSQFNVLGLPSLNSISAKTNSSSGSKTLADGLPEIVDGKQILKMNASASGYSPNLLKVRVGIPVRWEITDTGTSGCTNAVLSPELFDGRVMLSPGTTSVKEFTPQKTGKFRFSCWMGMVTGIIEVVNNDGTASSNSTSAVEPPAAAGGCGCGGGGVSSCGAAR